MKDVRRYKKWYTYGKMYMKIEYLPAVVVQVVGM